MTVALRSSRAADVVIVGAGQAGGQAAIALRQKGFAGTIALIGDETIPPYERPPLSKDYLDGSKGVEKLLLKPESYWPERGVQLELGTTVSRIDLGSRQVWSVSGDVWRYGSLIWATGGRARVPPLPGVGQPGVWTIRTRDDVDGLRGDLERASRAVVVGGGYIGLEAASALRKRGLSVTLIEAQSRLLSRVAGTATADYFADLHRAQGVDLRLGTGVVAFEGGGDRVTGVRLSSGELISADLVVVGVGIEPAVGPLATVGLADADGVPVDALCRTPDPHVYAIGDCSRFANPWGSGRQMRVESVQNANDQAQVVAGVLVGDPKPYAALPWFWSHQFGVKLQSVGLADGAEQEVVRGDPTTDSFSVGYFKGDHLRAIDCVNLTRDYVQGRALLLSGVAVDPARFRDPAVLLSSLA